MTNRERARKIWVDTPSQHVSGISIIETALNEAEKRGMERAIAIVKSDRSVCDPQSEAWDWINDVVIRLDHAMKESQ